MNEPESTLEINDKGDRIWRNAAGGWHRTDGPALEGADGGFGYWVNDELHRLDGPAMRFADGREYWYLWGESVPSREVRAVQTGFAQNPDAESVPTRGRLRETHWRDAQGRLHRLDGPAIECPNGEEYWYRHGVLHREGAPAQVMIEGQGWWVDGEHHRLDGPAVDTTMSDGWRQREWWVNGKRHRTDGPAVEHTSPDGWYHREWWVNGVQHHSNGPAVEDQEDGDEYWLNGVQVRRADVMPGGESAEDADR